MSFRKLTIPTPRNASRSWTLSDRSLQCPDAYHTMAVTAPLPSRLNHIGWSQARTIRLILLMVAVWALHTFDLHFTMTEASKGDFVELNPVAAIVLNTSYIGIVLYKYLLLGAASVILWHLREHAITERAGWLLLITAVMLFIRWQMYFELTPDVDLHYMQPLAVGT